MVMTATGIHPSPDSEKFSEIISRSLSNTHERSSFQHSQKVPNYTNAVLCSNNAVYSTKVQYLKSLMLYLVLLRLFIVNKYNLDI